MNVLNKLTKKNLLLNKKRTVVTIIGIMLSTALVCAVAGLVTSAQQTFVNLIKNSDGDYHAHPGFPAQSSYWFRLLRTY